MGWIKRRNGKLYYAYIDVDGTERTRLAQGCPDNAKGYDKAVRQLVCGKQPPPPSSTLCKQHLPPRPKYPSAPRGPPTAVQSAVLPPQLQPAAAPGQGERSAQQVPSARRAAAAAPASAPSSAGGPVWR